MWKNTRRAQSNAQNRLFVETENEAGAAPINQSTSDAANNLNLALAQRFLIRRCVVALVFLAPY